MRQQKLYIDLLGWVGLYLFWIIVFRKTELAFSQTATVEFCYLLFIGGNYYFNAWLNIPRFLHRKRYVQFCVYFIAAIVVAALARVPVAMLLNSHVFIPGRPQPGFSALFKNSALNIGVWTCCLVAIKIIADRYRLQQYVDEVNKQKEQAELDFLNAQLNPHFLFNSINSIYGYIDKANSEARGMLLTFSDMLRYQLYECNESLVPIHKETGYIRNYIALQKVRKNEHLKVEVDIPEMSGFMVSPLLFIAFIENSFKYVGSGEEAGDFVHVAFSKENGSLHFVCRNSKNVNVTAIQEHKGIGISNARRRLGLLYPGRHELTITDEPETFEVNLKISIHET